MTYRTKHFIELVAIIVVITFGSIGYVLWQDSKSRAPAKTSPVLGVSKDKKPVLGPNELLVREWDAVFMYSSPENFSYRMIVTDARSTMIFVEDTRATAKDKNCSSENGKTGLFAIERSENGTFILGKGDGASDYQTTTYPKTKIGNYYYIASPIKRDCKQDIVDVNGSAKQAIETLRAYR
jgi:hypothetical protein